jgi:hypothetical protein
MFKRVLFGVFFFAGLGLLIWGSDRVTFQGERTIYTANCEPDVWQGMRCTGKLVAGPRYRYRSLKTRREVIFWIAGSRSRPENTPTVLCKTAATGRAKRASKQELPLHTKWRTTGLFETKAETLDRSTPYLSGSGGLWTSA